MKEPDASGDALKWVRANRISTAEQEQQSVEENVCIVEESIVTIDVEGIETYTLLCLPNDLQALAVGFLFSEGVISRMTDIEILKECEDDPTTIRVRLTSKVPRIQDAERNLLIVSSCGACGSENLRKRLDALPNVGDLFRVEVSSLRTVHDALYKSQSLFQACGGTQAAAVFDGQGEIVAYAEDTGRHNALDKAIGMCLLSDIQLVGRGVALTSRLSLEMVSKCTVAGIELISSVSAPTSMAIDVAQNCKITLCAFVRETRATVFTHPARIVGITS